MNFKIIIYSIILWTWTTEAHMLVKRAEACDQSSFDDFSGRVKFRRKGQRAVFRCPKSFDRHGPRFADCQPDGTWDSEAPLCVKSGCVTLDIGTRFNLEMDAKKAVVTFQCLNKYVLIGDHLIYCDGQQWSAPLPRCAAPHELTECDFEADLCGWTQDDNDERDWIRNSGITTTGDTGPKYDHTYMTASNGHYMYFETSTPTETGDTAALRSPSYPKELSPICFDFWYHVEGPDEPGLVGDLDVYVVDESEFIDDVEPVFTRSGNQGTEWLRGDIQIDQQDESFQIVFVATKRKSYISDMAIDDVRLYNCTDNSTIGVTTEKPTTSTPSTTSTTTLSTSTTMSLTTEVFTPSETTVKATTSAPTKSTTQQKTMTPTTTANPEPTTTKSPTTVVTMTTTEAVTPTPVPMTTEAPTTQSTTTAAMTTLAPTTTIKPTITSPTVKSTTTTPQTTTPAATTVVPLTTQRPTTTSAPKTSSPSSSSTSKQPTRLSSTTKTVTSTPAASAATSKRTSTANTPVPSSASTSKQTTNVPQKSSSAVVSVTTKSPTTPKSSKDTTKSTPKATQKQKTVTTKGTPSGNSTKDNSVSVVDQRSKHPGDDTLTPLMIGLGVGIVVGLIIIGVIAYVCVRRRKFYTSRYEDELKPITSAGSVHSLNNDYYKDEEYESES